MIQKAKRSNRYDLEAEIGRFVCLYVQRNYTAAVQRCVHCLDALKLFEEIESPEAPDLPYRQMQYGLERALHQAMVMRGDRLYDLTRHLWKVHEGEYYLLKRPGGFLDAIMGAWWALRSPVRIEANYLHEILHHFSQRVIEFYESAGDLEEVEGESEEDGGEDAGAAAGPREKPGPDPFAEILVSTDRSGKTPENLDPIFEAAERTRSIPAMGAFARILARLAPKDRIRAYSALRRNEAFTSTSRMAISDADAARLHKELEAYYAE